MLKIKLLNLFIAFYAGVALVAVLSSCNSEPSGNKDSSAGAPAPAPTSTTETPTTTNSTTTPSTAEPTPASTLDAGAQHPDVNTGAGNTGATLTNPPAGPKYTVVRLFGSPMFKGKVVEEGLEVNDLSKVSFEKTSDMFVASLEGKNSSFMIHPMPFAEKKEDVVKPCAEVNCELAITPSPFISPAMEVKNLPVILAKQLKLQREGKTLLLDKTKILLPDGKFKYYQFQKKNLHGVGPVTLTAPDHKTLNQATIHPDAVKKIKAEPNTQKAPAATQQPLNQATIHPDALKNIKVQPAPEAAPAATQPQIPVMKAVPLNNNKVLKKAKEGGG